MCLVCMCVYVFSVYVCVSAKKMRASSVARLSTDCQLGTTIAFVRCMFTKLCLCAHFSIDFFFLVIGGRTKRGMNSRIMPQNWQRALHAEVE